MRNANRPLLALICVLLAASCGEDGDPAAPGGGGPVNPGDSHWRDGCTGRDLTGFGLSKQTDLCNGD
jgi:hypothetical protein